MCHWSTVLVFWQRQLKITDSASKLRHYATHKAVTFIFSRLELVNCHIHECSRGWLKPQRRATHPRNKPLVVKKAKCCEPPRHVAHCIRYNKSQKQKKSAWKCSICSLIAAEINRFYVFFFFLKLSKNS